MSPSDDDPDHQEGGLFVERIFEIPVIVQITRKHRVLVPMFSTGAFGIALALRGQRSAGGACGGRRAALAGWGVKCAGKRAWCVG